MKLAQAIMSWVTSGIVFLTNGTVVNTVYPTQIDLKSFPAVTYL